MQAYQANLILFTYILLFQNLLGTLADSLEKIKK